MHPKLDHHTSTFYVVGNGPSLRPYELELLPDNQWLGMNSAFKYWHQINKYPKYYACLDPVVVKSQYKGIVELLNRRLITKFFLHEAILDYVPLLEGDPRITLLKDFGKANLNLKMGDLATLKKTTGALAVRYVIEQGHYNLCLLGIDCNYVEMIAEAKKTEGLELEISNQVKKNPNYFFDDYQAAGDKYQVPNPPTHDGNLHLQSFIALSNDIKQQNQNITISVASPKSLLYQYNIFSRTNLSQLLNRRRLACIAVPIILNELDDLLNNLSLWDDPRLLPSLQTKSKGTALHLFIDRGYQEDIINKLDHHLSQLKNLPYIFEDVKITFLDLPNSVNFYAKKGEEGENAFFRKAGPNIHFFSMMAHCEIYEYTFLMEVDCIPVRPGWLDALEASIGQGSTLDPWIMGSLYHGVSNVRSAYRFHINGNAIYKTGDPDFQTFLSGCFTDTFQDLVRQGHDHLAYDTVVSCILDGEITSDKCQTFLSTIMARYRYSEVILNYGGEQETKTIDLIDYSSIITNNKNCYLLHGQSPRNFVIKHYTAFDTFYTFLNKSSKDLLAFDRMWSPDKALKCLYLTKGGFEIESKSEISEVYLFYIRSYRHDSSEASVTFQVDSETELIASNIFVQTESYARIAIETDVLKMPLGSYCKAEIKEQASQYRRFGVRLKFRSKTKKVLLKQVNFYETALNQNPQRLKIEVESPNASIPTLVKNWEMFLDQIRYQAGIVIAPSSIPIKTWQAQQYRLKFEFNEGNQQPKTKKETYFSVHIKRPFFDNKTTSRIHIKLTAEQPQKMILRICRHGSTQWEYKDIELKTNQETSITNPFIYKHNAYRIEILQLDLPSNNFSLEIISANSSEIQSHDNEINFREIQEHKKELLRALLQGNQSALQKHIKLLQSIQQHEVIRQTISSLLYRKKEYFALLQLLKYWKNTTPNYILPKLAYIDPIHKDTTSATQELRKKLLSDYDQNRLTLIYPDKNQGYWIIDNPLEPKQKIKTEDLPKVLVKVDSIICRAGYQKNDAQNFYTSLTRVADKLIIYMMDTWDKRLREASNNDKSRLILTSFKQLIQSSKGIIAISESMAEYVKETYDRTSSAVVHNYVSQDVTHVAHNPRGDKQIKLLYAGGLEQDMTFSAISTLAETVHKLNLEQVHLYIKTFHRHAASLKQIQEKIGHTNKVTFIAKDLKTEEYQVLLKQTNVQVMAYNTNKQSESYVKHSFPNKFSDYLSTAKPIVYFGPEYAIAKNIEELNIQGITWLKNEKQLEEYLANLSTKHPEYLRSIQENQAEIQKRYSQRTMLNKFYKAIFDTIANDREEVSAMQNLLLSN